MDVGLNTKFHSIDLFSLVCTIYWHGYSSYCHKLKHPLHLKKTPTKQKKSHLQDILRDENSVTSTKTLQLSSEKPRSYWKTDNSSSGWNLTFWNINVLNGQVKQTCGRFVGLFVYLINCCFQQKLSFFLYLKSKEIETWLHIFFFLWQTELYLYHIGGLEVNLFIHISIN